jgi:hypothetical protein
MSILTEAELNTALADNQTRSITPSHIRDLVDSVIAIAGTMYASGVDLDITTAYVPAAPFPFFTNSIDTKGLTEDLTKGHFTVTKGGVYKAEATLCIDSPFNGEITLAIVKNGALTPYEVTYTVTSGVKIPFLVSGTGTLVDGDTVGLAIKGSGNATLPMIHGTLIVTKL